MIGRPDFTADSDLHRDFGLSVTRLRASQNCHSTSDDAYELLLSTGKDLTSPAPL